MLVQAFEDEGHSDTDKEREGQDFQGRMPHDKVAERFGKCQHAGKRNQNRQNNHLHVRGQTHGCDDRINRKNRIQKHDLNNGRGESRRHRLTNPRAIFVGGMFHTVVDFLHGFPCEKQSARQQDEIFHRETESRKRDHRVAHGDEQTRSTERGETQNERQKQPDIPRLVPQCGIDARDCQSDDQDIVDAQNQFEAHQQGQCRPGAGRLNPRGGPIYDNSCIFKPSRQAQTCAPEKKNQKHENKSHGGNATKDSSLREMKQIRNKGVVLTQT